MIAAVTRLDRGRGTRRREVCTTVPGIAGPPEARHEDRPKQADTNIINLTKSLCYSRELGRSVWLLTSLLKKNSCILLPTYGWN